MPGRPFDEISEGRFLFYCYICVDTFPFFVMSLTRTILVTLCLLAGTCLNAAAAGACGTEFPALDSPVLNTLVGDIPAQSFKAGDIPTNNFTTSNIPALDARLQEATLRVDYIFSGTDKECRIAVDELNRLEGWAGRRVRMQDVPLRGNGQVCMTAAADGDTLYRMSFSTLFQEWQATEEATRVSRSFENVFLLPMPTVPVNITVELYDFHAQVVASLTHPVDPEDILIRPKGGFTQDDVLRYAAAGRAAGALPPGSTARANGLVAASNSVASQAQSASPAVALSPSGIPARYVHYSGSPAECIDVVILAEGYTAAEMDTFFADATAASESLFNHEPFTSLSDRFNILAVAAPSADSGVSVPRQGLWKSTAVSSHFDTFYSDRYLTTLRLKQLHDVLADFPYEHIIILANTDTYGGGGIYNSYTLTTAHHAQFKPVVVHEFGHSFAGLADEYFYDDQFVEYYYPDTEPWEQNITTLADFASKWQDMLPAGTVLPDGSVVADRPDGLGSRLLNRLRNRSRIPQNNLRSGVSQPSPANSTSSFSTSTGSVVSRSASSNSSASSSTGSVVSRPVSSSSSHSSVVSRPASSSFSRSSTSSSTISNATQRGSASVQRQSRSSRARRRSIEGVGLYEGGGYQSKGVWRGAEDCRMRTNSAPVFCPVCQQAITDIIDFYTTD